LPLVSSFCAWRGLCVVVWVTWSILLYSKQQSKQKVKNTSHTSGCADINICLPVASFYKIIIILFWKFAVVQ
jgi:hypothetical protein